VQFSPLLSARAWGRKMQMMRAESGEGSSHFVVDGFERDVEALGQELRSELGAADIRHLRMTEWAGRICTLLGLATAWIAPNPVSVFLLAQGKMARFFIGHHVLHGAYDRVPGMPERFTRKKFGRGWRRFVDWLDWWNLDDWSYTHNQLHHPFTQAPMDADLMPPRPERPLPAILGYAIFAFATVTWKFSYYAPRMHRERVDRDRGTLRGAPYQMTAADVLDMRDPAVRQLWLRDYMPFVAVTIALPVAIAALLGPWAAMSMLVNLVLAELLHNAQTFICIRPSHCAADIPLFDKVYANREDFFLQSVLGTVNYPGGGRVQDFLHGWTNYQIEHHLWPTLTLHQYRRARPRVIAICARYGVPYRQGNVFVRFAKAARLFAEVDSQQIFTTAQSLETLRSETRPKMA
jgi:fatty acid desaturase